MALADMMGELRGAVPKIPHPAYTKILVNRAYKEIREKHLWSFNLYESSWISPPLITAGTATVVQGSPTVTVDATAAAAINAGSTLYSLITQRQFRIGISGIYNIIAWDTVNTLTLDRIYADPSAAGAAYQIYQAYYTPPMQDHLLFLSVRNMQLFFALGLDLKRSDIDRMDPQRSWYLYPSEVVLFGMDQRGVGTANASATLNYPMFELWGQAQAPYPYQLYGIRKGVDLASLADQLPVSVGEDLVVAKAKSYAYEWAEANKEQSPRAVGPDWRFLMKQTEDRYADLLKTYRKNDRELVDNYFIRAGLNANVAFRRHSYYNTIGGGYAGTASPSY